MVIYSPAKAAEYIPVIDLAPAVDEAGKLVVAREIHQACGDIGFFHVVNHGVPPPLIDAQFDWARRFFDLTTSPTRSSSRPGRIRT